MLFKLDEMERVSKPDPKKHWILPGTVRAGAKIALTGNKDAGKSLVAAEIAISASTGTKFFSMVDPWITGRTLYFAGDTYKTTTMLRNILNGRGIKAPEDLRLVPAPDNSYRAHGIHTQYTLFWDAIRTTVQEFNPKLIIIDPDTDFIMEGKANSVELVKRKTLQFFHLGITVILCSRNPDMWRDWRDSQLVVEQDTARNILHLRGGATTITRVQPVFTKNNITFIPMPNLETTNLEANVWRFLFETPVATEGDIKKALGVKNKNLVADALASLKEKDLIKFELQKKQLGGKSVKVWSINV